MNILVQNIVAFATIFGIMIYIVFRRKRSIVGLSKRVNTIRNEIQDSIFFKKLQYCIARLEMQKIINKNSKIITPTRTVIVSITITFIAYAFIYQIFKVKSTAIILSVPIFFIPLFILKYLLSKQKNMILINFPTYIINLKNNISTSGDIIYAIQKTNVNEPLKLYIDTFNAMINRGVNVYESFEKLKENIGIKKINNFITACQMCYKNGGDFNEILTRFSSFITKDNIQRDKLKESSYSSIMTLSIMAAMNIYLIFAFVFRNKEYAHIIRNTFGGVVILNFTAITYIVIGYLILKIYRMEEE